MVLGQVLGDSSEQAFGLGPVRELSCCGRIELDPPCHHEPNLHTDDDVAILRGQGDQVRDIIAIGGMKEPGKGEEPS